VKKNDENLYQLQRIFWTDAFDFVAVVTAEQDAQVHELIWGHFQSFHNLEMGQNVNQPEEDCGSQL
jgi:hypothetical protein